MWMLANYLFGIFLGMVLMKLLLESRIFYHLNTLSLHDLFDKLLEYGKSNKYKKT